MKLKSRIFAAGLGATALGAIALGAGVLAMAAGSGREAAAQEEIKVPQLAGEALAGATLFTRYCAKCHGAVGGGTDRGPPLINRIYEPNHHADFAFVMAAKRGVRAHHWRFGNMPPVEGIGDEDLIKIIAFVRALQKENGIF